MSAQHPLKQLCMAYWPDVETGYLRQNTLFTGPSLFINVIWGVGDFAHFGRGEMHAD